MFEMATIGHSDRASARAATVTSLGLVPAATAAKQQAGSETWIPNWANTYTCQLPSILQLPRACGVRVSYFPLSLRLSLS
jgi:hypothetical protein